MYDVIRDRILVIIEMILYFYFICDNKRKIMEFEVIRTLLLLAYVHNDHVVLEYLHNIFRERRVYFVSNLESCFFFFTDTFFIHIYEYHNTLTVLYAQVSGDCFQYRISCASLDSGPICYLKQRHR